MTTTININIKAPDFIFDIQAFKNAIPSVMLKVGWDAHDFWKTIAGQRLKSSRNEYQEAIRMSGASGTNSISLRLEGGFLPAAIEEGTPAYPMRLGRGKVAPLNVTREIIFTSPQVWRTGTGEPWMHPGFPGFHMLNDVEDYIVNEAFPKHIEDALEKL